MIIRIKNIALLLICILLIASSPLLSSPYGANKKGIKEYDKQNYESALTNFRQAQIDDPKSPIVQFNVATSLYQQKKYDKAISELQKAAQTANDPKVLSQIWYSMGNSFFMSDSLLKSIECFKKSLDYNPNDKDAKYNLELARALLKELSKKEQSQEQQQSGGQGQQQQAQQDSSSSDSTKNQQQNQQQNQQEQNQEQQAGQPKEGDMSKDEAERILKAIEQSDKDQQNNKEIPISGGEYHEKDW